MVLFLLIAGFWLTSVTHRHMPDEISGSRAMIVHELSDLGPLKNRAEMDPPDIHFRCYCLDIQDTKGDRLSCHSRDYHIYPRGYGCFHCDLRGFDPFYAPR